MNRIKSARARATASRRARLLNKLKSFAWQALALLLAILGQILLQNLQEAFIRAQVLVNSILQYVLCCILPPLAVYSVKVNQAQLFLNCVLTCCLWIPGVIHALIHVRMSHDQGKNDTEVLLRPAQPSRTVIPVSTVADTDEADYSLDIGYQLHAFVSEAKKLLLAFLHYPDAISPPRVRSSIVRREAAAIRPFKLRSTLFAGIETTLASSVEKHKVLAAPPQLDITVPAAALSVTAHEHERLVKLGAIAKQVHVKAQDKISDIKQLIHVEEDVLTVADSDDLPSLAEESNTETLAELNSDNKENVDPEENKYKRRTIFQRSEHGGGIRRLLNKE